MQHNQSPSSTNVDPAELEKFSQLAHRWWDPHSEFRPLHEINPLRLGWIEQQVSLAGKDVLDVGCGGGILAEAMARRGARVTGIDLAEKPLKVAQLHLLESRQEVRYELASAEEFAERHAGGFDVVTCMELLEHVPDPASTVAACARLLPKGTHDYRRFVRPSELARWCRDAGLRTAAMTGMSYNPLTRRYWLGQDCDVNYLVCCAKDG